MTQDGILRAAEKIAAAYREVPGVIAVALGGSLAVGTADQYSDVDLFIIAGERDLPGVLDRSAACLRLSGDVLFLERIDHGFPMDVFIFSGGLRGEIGFGTPETLDDLYYGPFVVLYDSTGALSGHVFPGWDPFAGQTHEAWTASRLRWFWRAALNARMYFERGDLWSMASRLETMRNMLAGIMRAQRQDGRMLVDESVLKVGRVLPDVELEALKGTFFVFGSADIRRAFRALCEIGTQIPRLVQIAERPELHRLSVLAVGDERGFSHTEVE